LPPASTRARLPSVHSQGSRTRPGLHAAAREYAGSPPVRAFPGLADSPWATRCRPRVRGLASLPCIPRARGLALGYTLPPASTRARLPSAHPQGSRTTLGYTLPPASTRARLPSAHSQGSRTRPGLHAVAREYAGSPPFRASPGLADSPCATRCRPRVRGLASLPRIPRARGLALGYTLAPANTRARLPSAHPQGSRTRPGLHAGAREYA